VKGRPDPPEDVALVRVVFDVDGNRATVGLWLFVPGLQLLAVSQLEDIVAGVYAYLLPLTDNNMHAGAAVARVELLRWGMSPLRVIRFAPPNHGAWTGGQVLVASSTLHWLTGESGRGRTGVTHLPGFPDAYTSDHRTVNALGWGNLSTDAIAFLSGVNTIASPAGGDCVLGTLHFSAAGVPLAAATFSPIIGVTPGVMVGTLDRRRLSSG
jgi:hypothetical protein